MYSALCLFFEQVSCFRDRRPSPNQAMEPPAQLTFEPLRNLNSSSAKACTFSVRVLCGENPVGFFNYGAQKKETMHTFDCILIGDDPAMYVPGTLKSPKEEIIKRAATKFAHGTQWAISNVAFDSRAKAAYISAPKKLVVLMDNPTKFNAVLETVLALPRAPQPSARVSAILKLRQSKAFYDVAGVLREGPLNEREPMTKSGKKKAADFQLVQKPIGQEDMRGLDFTAWSGMIEKLRPLVGKYVALFKLEVALQSPGTLQCETSFGAFVLPLTMDESVLAFIATLKDGTAGAADVVTSKWTPTEPTVSLDGEQPLVCASFLAATAGNMDPNSDLATWQLCGAHLDVPTGAIHNQKGTSLWFNTGTRDFSGDIEAGITEAAAVSLAGVRSREEFEAKFAEGALQFPRCNVRGYRRIVNGEVRYTIGQSSPCTDVLPLTKQANHLYDLLKVFGRTSGGIVPGPLAKIEADPFAGLVVAGLPARKALVLVKGLERSKMEVVGTQRKMSTLVKCYWEDTEPEGTRSYHVVAFCHEEYVSDYKFDKGQAMVVVTGLELVNPETGAYEILAEHITTIIGDDMPRVRTALTMQLGVAENSLYAVSDAAGAAWTETPPHKNKRCRTIGAYPSDPL